MSKQCNRPARQWLKRGGGVGMRIIKRRLWRKFWRRKKPIFAGKNWKFMLCWLQSGQQWDFFCNINHWILIPTFLWVRSTDPLPEASGLEKLTKLTPDYRLPGISQFCFHLNLQTFTQAQVSWSPHSSVTYCISWHRKNRGWREFAQGFLPGKAEPIKCVWG